MLSIDDCSGCSWLSCINIVSNKLYNLLKIRRHLGIFATIINIHSFTLVNSHMR